MRVWRRGSRARVPSPVRAAGRATHAARAARAALCCLPGGVAVVLLLMCALFVGPGTSPGQSGESAESERAGDAQVALAGHSGRSGLSGLSEHSGLDERAGVTGLHSDMPAAAAPVRRMAGHPAARPRVVPRTDWLPAAVREQPPARYADRVRAVFVHHTDSPNSYDCGDVPRIIRYLYAGQTEDRQWDDIGYNFLVDRCGTVYEGRAGGIDRPVVGAHTQGFNRGSVGIAAIGTFTEGVPVPKAMTDAVAALVAWKLGLSDVDPRSTVRLVSSNSLSKYAAGKSGLFSAVSGHRDGYYTQCPGAALTSALPSIREEAARLQGR